MLSHLLDRPPGSRRSRIGAVIIVRALGGSYWVHSTRGSHSIALRTFFLLIFKDGGSKLIISCNFKDRSIARCSLVESDFTSLSDDVRASPVVWQIELPSLIFGKKTLKILLQQFGKRLDNFLQFGKNQSPARKYTRAARGCHRGF